MTGWGKNAFGPNWPPGRPPGLADAFGIRPDHRVLEVGGGGNAWSRANVICDLTFGCSAQRNGAPAVLEPGKRYVEAAVESLPFSNLEFDFVYCTQVLEHVRDPERAAAELSRVARRGFVEVPSRFGELTHGNPTHRWIVDRDDDSLVFHTRPFVEHPLRSFFYGILFQNPELRHRCEEEYRNLFNHQLLWEGTLKVRIAPHSGGEAFHYENPSHALRAHWSFARDTLAAGAPPEYAFPELLEARRRAPDSPRLRELHAVYLARQGRIDEAMHLVTSPSAHAGSELMRLFRQAAGGRLHPRDIPIPPYPSSVESDLLAESPRGVSVLAAAGHSADLRTSVVSALTQDYPDVVVFAVVLPGQETALAGLEFGPRLVVVPAPSLVQGFNSAATRAGTPFIAFAIDGDHLLAHHLVTAVAYLENGGVDAIHTRALFADGAGGTRANLDPNDPLHRQVRLSTVVARRSRLATLGLLSDLPWPDSVAHWLGRLARTGSVANVEAATVLLSIGATDPAAVLPPEDMRGRLDPMELWREVIAGATRVRGLEQRIADLELALAERGTP